MSGSINGTFRFIFTFGLPVTLFYLRNRGKFPVTAWHNYRH